MPHAYTVVVNDLQQDIRTLVAFIREYPRLVVLTGAGISVDSGIPTYRDSDGRWLHSTPIRHHEFITSAATRAATGLAPGMAGPLCATPGRTLRTAPWRRWSARATSNAW
ncbi:MAG: hypothetical protein R3E54_10250 [Halioglobus sp.]